MKDKINGEDIKILEKVFAGEIGLTSLNDLFKDETKAERIKKAIEFNKNDIKKHIGKTDKVAKDLWSSCGGFSLINVVLIVIIFCVFLNGINLFTLPIIKFLYVISLIGGLSFEFIYNRYTNKKYNEILEEVNTYLKMMEINEKSEERVKEEKTNDREFTYDLGLDETLEKEKTLVLSRKKHL